MSDLVLLLPLALIVLGLVVWWRAGRQRQQTGIPDGHPVYADTREFPGIVLYARHDGLKGRPDFLIQQGAEIIPVEAKTGRTPTQPYWGHIMQLTAYCVLVEAHYGIRPPYGIIRYPQRQFQVDFTLEREQQLRVILADMRQAQALDEAHRSHQNPRLCAACGYRVECDESLHQQDSLWPE